MAAPRRPRSLGRRPVALSLLAGALTTLLAAHAHDVGRQFGRGRSLPTLIAVQPDAVLVERRWLSERTISCELYGTALPATRGEAIRRAGEVTWSDDPLLGLASLTMPSPRDDARRPSWVAVARPRGLERRARRRRAVDLGSARRVVSRRVT